MLLRHVDRHHPHRLRVGDTLKLPMSLPRPFAASEAPYKHGLFKIVALPVYGEAASPNHRLYRPFAHCLLVQRLADGWVTTLAMHYWERLREEYAEPRDATASAIARHDRKRNRAIRPQVRAKRLVGA